MGQQPRQRGWRKPNRPMRHQLRALLHALSSSSFVRKWATAIYSMFHWCFYRSAQNWRCAGKLVGVLASNLWVWWCVSLRMMRAWKRLGAKFQVNVEQRNNRIAVVVNEIVQVLGLLHLCFYWWVEMEKVWDVKNLWFCWDCGNWSR